MLQAASGIAPDDTVFQAGANAKCTTPGATVACTDKTGECFCTGDTTKDAADCITCYHPYAVDTEACEPFLAL